MGAPSSEPQGVSHHLESFFLMVKHQCGVTVIWPTSEPQELWTFRVFTPLPRPFPYGHPPSRSAQRCVTPGARDRAGRKPRPPRRTAEGGSAAPPPPPLLRGPRNTPAPHPSAPSGTPDRSGGPHRGRLPERHPSGFRPAPLPGLGAPRGKDPP